MDKNSTDIIPIITSLVIPIATLITAIAAISAPIITAIFNNRTQLKLKKLDLCYKEKFDIYQRYCNSIVFLDEWEYGDDPTIDTPNDEYLKIHKLTYLIGTKKIRSLLDSLSSNFNSPCMNAQKYEHFKSEILKLMSEDLENYKF